jgi:hypothetical protein
MCSQNHNLPNILSQLFSEKTPKNIEYLCDCNKSAKVKNSSIGENSPNRVTLLPRPLALGASAGKLDLKSCQIYDEGNFIPGKGSSKYL